MIISAPTDYREAARRRLPPFLFHYIDGGAYAEHTLRHNVSDLSDIALRQRVLRDVADIDLGTTLFGRSVGMPVVLAPVGLTGMYARRGEVQAARAAASKQVPFTLSTVSVCAIDEVQRQSPAPIWFQLYVLKDRGFMRDALERAQAAGVETLVFTVDMPVPGARYRDAHSGMSGPGAAWRRMLQAVTHPRWAWDVGIHGRPHDLGNISAYRGAATGLEDYIGWLGANFDPGIGWRDLQWIRDVWKGSIVIKGILDVEDAREAVRFRCAGYRRVEPWRAAARRRAVIGARPARHRRCGEGAADDPRGLWRAIGLDVVRMLALGADAAMLGRAFIYALAADGQAGVANLLDLFDREMRVAMALTGVRTIADIDSTIIAR